MDCAWCDFFDMRPVVICSNLASGRPVVSAVVRPSMRRVLCKYDPVTRLWDGAVVIALRHMLNLWKLNTLRRIHTNIHVHSAVICCVVNQVNKSLVVLKGVFASLSKSAVFSMNGDVLFY